MTRSGVQAALGALNEAGIRYLVAGGLVKRLQKERDDATGGGS